MVLECVGHGCSELCLPPGGVVNIYSLKKGGAERKYSLRCRGGATVRQLADWTGEVNSEKPWETKESNSWTWGDMNHACSHETTR